MPSVSVIIPAYNEEKRLSSTLNKIDSYLSSRDLDCEIILVDDGSSDKTAEIARESSLGIKVFINEKNSGKGFSIKRGVKEASKELILFSDADMSTPIEFLDRFIELHNEGYDVVLASRAVPGAKKKVKQPFTRDFMGRVFNFFMRNITGLPFHDTQCGFKSFKKEAADKIFGRQTIYGFGFDVEILYIANILEMKIKEEPVEWYNVLGTTVSAISDSIRMFGNLIDIKRNHKKGLYN